jgi:hypothetical protein
MVYFTYGLFYVKDYRVALEKKSSTVSAFLIVTFAVPHQLRYDQGVENPVDEPDRRGEGDRSNSAPPFDFPTADDESNNRESTT